MRIEHRQRCDRMVEGGSVPWCIHGKWAGLKTFRLPWWKLEPSLMLVKGKMQSRPTRNLSTCGQRDFTINCSLSSLSTCPSPMNSELNQQMKHFLSHITLSLDFSSGIFMLRNSESPWKSHLNHIFVAVSFALRMGVSILVPSISVRWLWRRLDSVSDKERESWARSFHWSLWR